jgi:predicted ATPase/DNA-binding XRE family transcriptional regulator
MASVEPRAFGTLLGRYRRAAGLTQEALAQEAGLSVRGISDLERGVNRVPRAETLLALVEALRLEPPERAALERAARSRNLAAAPPSTGTALSFAEPHPPLAGRTREIAALQECLAGVGPPLLLLAGEPGIGKTRLLQEATRCASEASWRILQGGCHQTGGQAPFAPLLEALETYVHAQPVDRLRAELEGCSWLARLLPELAESAIISPPRRTLPPEQERRLMFAAVRRFLANVADASGTLLVLDDLQWADDDALALLATLLRAPAKTPLRVVGTFRSTEVRSHDHLLAALAELVHDGLANLTQVGPLAPQEAAILLEHWLHGSSANGTELAERIQERCGGNPFFLVSCAQALRARALEGEAASIIPWNVAHSIAQRLIALSPPTCALLHAAAVAHGQIDRSVLIDLAAQARQSDDEALASLESLCQARLLEEAGADAYIFAHELIRESVLASLSAARRALLHQRVAEVLERQPGPAPVAALAYHYQQAGKPEQAIAYLERAGDQARAIHATAEAASYYQALVACLDTLGHASDSARARTKLGAMLGAAARYDQALEALEQAAAIFEAAGAVDELRRTLAQMGHVHASRGTPEVGLARLEPLLPSGSEQHPAPGLAAVHEALALLYYFTDRPAQQLAHAEQAMQLARALGDDALLVQAQHGWGLALLMVGQFAKGLQAEEEAISLAERMGDLATLVRALNNIGHLHDVRGAHDQSRRFLERAFQTAERLEDPGMIAYIASNLGQMAFRAGDWEAARQAYERALKSICQMTRFIDILSPLLGLGELCLAQGQSEAADRYFAEARSLAGPRWEVQGLLRTHLLLAERDLLDGRPAAARARLEPLLDRLSRQEGVLTALLPLLAWALLELGEASQAEVVLAENQIRARTRHDQVAQMHTLRIHALLAIRQRRWSEARRFLEKALRLAQRLGFPYDEAKVLYTYGLLHRQPAADHRLARARLEAAQAILRRLGERSYAAQVAHTLAILDEKVD